MDYTDADIDALLRGLRPAGAPVLPRAPAVGWRGRGRTVLAVAAGLLLAVGLGQSGLDGDRSRPRVLRRGPAPVSASGELRMLVSRADRALRVGDGSAVYPGEWVVFRLCAPVARPLVLVLHGPGGRETLLETEVSAGCVDARAGGELLAYAFESPGPHHFVLTTPEGAVVDEVTLLVQ